MRVFSLVNFVAAAINIGIAVLTPPIAGGDLSWGNLTVGFCNLCVGVLCWPTTQEKN